MLLVDLCEHRIAIGRIVPQPRLDGRLANNVLRLVAEKCAETLVDFDHQLRLGVDHDVGVGGALEQRGKLGLALDQCLLVASPLGNVDQGADKALDPAAGAPIEPGRRLQPANRPPFVFQAIGQPVAGQFVSADGNEAATQLALVRRLDVSQVTRERAVPGFRRVAMQHGHAGAAVQNAGVQVPVPGPHLRCVQGQSQAFLAVAQFGTHAARSCRVVIGVLGGGKATMHPVHHHAAH